MTGARGAPEQVGDGLWRGLLQSAVLRRVGAAHLLDPLARVEAQRRRGPGNIASSLRGVCGSKWLSPGAQVLLRAARQRPGHVAGALQEALVAPAQGARRPEAARRVAAGGI